MGPSGAGKSTLASWFEDRGMAVLADDVCVIHFDEAGAPFTRSGIRRLRLWKDALEARGLQPSAFQPSYTGDPSFEKFDVPMTTHIASEVRLPLAAIYLLAKGQRTKVELLEGVEALDAIFAHTYRGGFVSQLRADTGHWAACVRLVDRTPVFRFVRRWGSADMNEQNSLLVAHATTLLETVSSSR
jgi:hypothetical protein